MEHATSEDYFPSWILSDVGWESGRRDLGKHQKQFFFFNPETPWYAFKVCQGKKKKKTQLTQVASMT